MKFRLTLRFRETDFEWKPFVSFRWRRGSTGYVGWLWFCFNWEMYEWGLKVLKGEKDHEQASAKVDL